MFSRMRMLCLCIEMNLFQCKAIDSEADGRSFDRISSIREQNFSLSLSSCLSSYSLSLSPSVSLASCLHVSIHPLHHPVSRLGTDLSLKLGSTEVLSPSTECIKVFWTNFSRRMFLGVLIQLNIEVTKILH